MKDILKEIKFPVNELDINKKEDLLYFFTCINRYGFLRFYNNEQLFEKIFSLIYKDFKICVFPEKWTFPQKMYHFLRNDNNFEIGKCKQCGKQLKWINFSDGYKHLFCSNKCRANNEEQSEKVKETCQNKYNCDYVTQSKEHILKREETVLKKYGCKHVFQSKKVKDKITQTFLKKYHVKRYTQTDEYKKQAILTCRNKFGKDFYTQTEEYLNKEYNTKKRHNSFNTSKIEIEFKTYLEQNNFNFTCQYKSELYPYFCDFYFPDYDLYLEIQGHWTHGKHPFDKNNEEDLIQLTKWVEKSKTSNFFKKAINVWTIKDVGKRNEAKKKGINYIEIYSNNINDVIEKFLNKIKQK